MGLISLDEAKNYLRVDTSDDDSLIETLLASAERLCIDVARISEEQWTAVTEGVIKDDEGNITSVTSDVYSVAETIQIHELMRVAILYALGYLYEHREEGDHHALVITLRNILFSVREGVI